MAAHPLPEDQGIPVATPNAATATDITLIPGQEVEWNNDYPTKVTITVALLNGYQPLSGNPFEVPGMGNRIVGTHENTVRMDAPLNTDYTFTRVGGTNASGRIKIRSVGK